MFAKFVALRNINSPYGATDSYLMVLCYVMLLLWV